MNVGRGLFRAWILLTVLWLVGVGTLAYFSIDNEISRGRWEYRHQLREGVRRPTLEEIFEGHAGPIPPYYEMMRSPSVEKLPVEFSQVRYQYIDSWDARAKEGKAVLIKMPDHSSLYLDTRLTKADQEYISQAFWDQRWSRLGHLAAAWTPILVGLPIVLFILGWAVLWVCRGFKTAPR